MKALMVALAIMAAPPEWRREAEDDGVTLDVQPQSDSGFDHLRVRGTSKAAAETLACGWWGPAADLKNKFSCFFGWRRKSAPSPNERC